MRKRKRRKDSKKNMKWRKIKEDGGAFLYS